MLLFCEWTFTVALVTTADEVCVEVTVELGMLGWGRSECKRYVEITGWRWLGDVSDKYKT